MSLTASTIANYQGYLATTAPDNATREHHLSIQRWMIGLMLFTGGATVYARIRAVREADRILTMMSHFPGTTHGVPADIVDLLTRLRGKQVVLAANLETTLDNINVNGIIDNVVAKFNQLDDTQKYLLYEDFGLLTEAGWKSLNENASIKIDNWLLLKNSNIAEARNLNVISNQRLVDGFLRYYAKSELRLALEKLYSELKRIKLIDEVGNDLNLFNNFRNDVSLFEGLIRYRFEPSFVSKFEDLLKPQNQTKLLDFLNRYGNCSDEGFRMIRSNVDIHVDRLLKYPEATHHIDYFNTRRAEMLPPNFKEADKGEFFNLHEIDNFIEVEIAYGGKARASLKTEAGDIIMESGILRGQSLDPLGLSNNLKALQQWSNKFQSEFNHFKRSINRHFEKIYAAPSSLPPLDKVVIDYKYMDEISVSIGQSSNYMRQEVDQYILSNFPQYNNSTYLIKVNY